MTYKLDAKTCDVEVNTTSTVNHVIHARVTVHMGTHEAALTIFSSDTCDTSCHSTRLQT